MTQYEVARGSIKLPFPKTASKTAAPRAQFIKQGDIIPEGVLSAEEIDSLLRDKRIQPLKGSVAKKASKARTQRRGPWSADPATLEGKSLEDLLVLVLGIDEDFNVEKLTTVEKAVAQLTKDWDPAFADDVAKAYDRSGPILGEGGAQQTGEPRELSDKAKAVLERARARAAAKGQTDGE